jgi:hypothetical protein
VGLPHSDIPGSKPAGGSPGLIAAIHVLHRLLVPRHPPCALASSASRSLESTKPAGSTFSKRHNQNLYITVCSDSVRLSHALHRLNLMPAQLLFDSSGTRPMLSRAPVVAPRPAIRKSRRHDQLSSSACGVGTKIARRSVEPRGLHQNSSAETYAVGDSSLRIIHLSSGRFQVRTPLNGVSASRECSLYPPVHRACKRGNLAGRLYPAETGWSRGDSNP